MNRFHKIAAIALSIGLLGGTSARAGETDVTVGHVSVFYGDVDLSKQTGAEVLFTRIRHATEEACGGKPESRDLTAMGQFRACTKAAMDSAVTRLGNAKVAALYGWTTEQTASRN